MAKGGKNWFNGQVQDFTPQTQSLPSKLAYGIVLATVILAPLLLVPVLTNFMGTSKLLLLSLTTIALAGLFIFHTAKHKVLEVPRSPLIPSLLFFGVAMFISSLLTTRYPVENFLGIGGALLAFAVIAIVGSLLIKTRSSHDFLNVFNASMILFCVLSVLQAVGFGPSRLINSLLQLNLPNTSLFNLSGSPFIAAQVFGVALLTQVISVIKRKKYESLDIAAIIASAIGLLLNAYLILPGKEASPLLLPFGVSWTIAIDVLKTPRSALIGVGPENFSAAYQILHPAWVNTTAWWNTSFGQASNVPLTLLTTTGLLGLAAWLLLTIKTVNYARVHFKQEPALMTLILACFALQLLLPINIVLLAIQAAAFAFLIANRPSRTNLSIHLFKIEKRDPAFDAPGRQPHLLIALLPLILGGLVVAAGLYGVGRAYAASYYFFQSSRALQANDAVSTYELQQQATLMNPYMASYRSNFALTNLAIATALANKTDATDQEKEQVSQLIQQSIREARAATLLKPDDSQTWQVLGQIYRSLIGSAEGADQWATSAYVQAISTSPNNPLLRIELGGLLFSLKQYPDANLLFQQAAELKPDLPNAYYNLANGLRAAGNLEQAKLAYQKTLSLLPANSDDYTKANQELEALEKEITAAAMTKDKEPTDETGTDASPTSQTGSLPSIVNQNVTQPDQSIVDEPSTADLNVAEPTPVPSPSPVVTPTP